jgi:hypothetical protein
MERKSFSKRQVKPQRGLPSYSLTIAKPRFSQSGAITPQVHTRAIQKPLKCINSPRESYYIIAYIISRSKSLEPFTRHFQGSSMLDSLMIKECSDGPHIEGWRFMFKLSDIE